MQAARALKGKSCGNGEFALSVYPSSQPVFLELAANGAAFDLMQSGASCAPPSAVRASARATRRRTMACPSATPLAISPTARDRSRARVSLRESPSWTPAPSPPRRRQVACSPPRPTFPRRSGTSMSSTASTRAPTSIACTTGSAGARRRASLCTVPTSRIGPRWSRLPRISSCASRPRSWTT